MNNDMQDEEMIRRLEQLGTVQPTPEATRQALDRVQATLATSPVRPEIGLTRDGAEAVPLFSRRFKRFAVASALLLGIGGLLTWQLPLDTAHADFAEVLAALQSPRSVTCRVTTGTNGKAVHEVWYLLLDKGLSRSEGPDGSYAITNYAGHRALAVTPRTREARLLEGLNVHPDNMFENIKNLPDDANARVLPAKKIEGKKALGFLIHMQGADLEIWVDAVTRLPVRIEEKDGDDNRETTRHVLDEFVFDQELDPKLFSLEPPAGYRVTTQGMAELPDVPADSQLHDPVVTPLVGVGPIKFGMSRADVEKRLGKPDAVKPMGPNGYVELNYSSRGMSIGVSPKNLGVTVITCMGQMVYRVRPFNGKTDKGIRLGASAIEIIQAYGEPDGKGSGTGTATLYYNKLEARFTLIGDQLVQMIFQNPVPAK